MLGLLASTPAARADTADAAGTADTADTAGSAGQRDPGSAATAASSSADAAAPPTNATKPTAVATKQTQEESRAFRWDARRFQWPDYAVTAVISGLYCVVELTQRNPRGAIWTKPVPVIDKPLRNLVVADTRRGREDAAHISDYLWYASVAYPMLVPPLIPPLRGGGFVPTWQMTMMDFQAFMTSSLLIRMPHKWIGRERPNTLGCRDDPDYDRQCTSKARFVSFPGGHAGISMTGAGLACAHHVHGKLLGSTTADVLACSGALGMASAVAVLRMRSDRHWASDTLVGSTVGLGVGYLMPTLFYYHPFWRDRPRASSAPTQPSTQWAVIPAFTDKSAQVLVSALGW